MANLTRAVPSRVRYVARPAEMRTGRASPNTRHARIGGMSTGTLVLLRHGESEWNALNLFT
ncbi:hypothetical protein GS575_12005, partial [Rhodococcus hoagii]|nr:hypothetical protein [Prescottella equi]